jgi:hypothetical protein
MLQKRCNDWTGDPWKISGNNYSNYSTMTLHMLVMFGCYFRICSEYVLNNAVLHQKEVY